MLLLLTEVCGVILVLVTLYKDKRIKQAEFIMNYNFEFISSEPLVDMERKLENCYQVYKAKLGGYKNDFSKVAYKKYEEVMEDMKDLVGFKLLSKTDYKVTRGYQKLINYLVYLESFAPLILTDQVQLKDIDDTFGYRYFIAMNNPIVQTYELLAEADYYCGCIQLYKKWYDYRIECKKEIPMECFALSNIDERNECKIINPIYQAKNDKDEKKDFKQIYINVSKGLGSKGKREDRTKADKSPKQEEHSSKKNEKSRHRSTKGNTNHLKEIRVTKYE